MLGWTWLVRYLHVLGAAVVVAAAFHVHWTARDEHQRRLLSRWLRAGLMFQVVIGAAMYALVFERAGITTHSAVIVGIAAVALAWVVSLALARGSCGTRAVMASVAVLLAIMLLAREMLQQAAFSTVTDEGMVAATDYERALAPHGATALAAYERALGTPIQTGDDVYDRSCSFCHGASGDGRTDAARDLAVPPERLRDVRSSRAELYRILTTGVPGSAMPLFAFYEVAKLDALISAMDARFGILRGVEIVPPSRIGQGEIAAMQTWAETCSGCHGPEGRPSGFGRKFLPAPPDLTRYSLQPSRGYQVISEGYPGTMMVSFGALPEDVRWGLVQVAASMRVSP